MKCNKCDNQAVFHYTSEINGEKSEFHLCPDCAKSEGFGEMLNFKPKSMFDSFFGNPFSMLYDSFFGSRMMAPALVMPRVMIQVGGDKAAEAVQTDTTKAPLEKTDNIPEDAGEEIRGKMELIKLRQEMKSAVEAEEFEKAAELRDKIRQLEG
ncbi:MAG: hypothetical protein GX025_01995 [Clostridiales bacterium]|nr:hypothetical protein [Clostridiales bacterium]